ncbi:MAG: hypothetical protein AAFX46_16790, partial [Cyanobacteria bacterium J06636_27]
MIGINIYITCNTVTNCFRCKLATTTDGNAGNIIISTLDLVNVKNSSKLASEAVGDGIAGNININ